MAGITGVPSKPAAGLDNIRVPPLKFKEIELPSGEKKSVPIPQEDDEGEEEEQNSDKSGKDQQFLSFDRSLVSCYMHFQGIIMPWFKQRHLTKQSVLEYILFAFERVHFKISATIYTK